MEMADEIIVGRNFTDLYQENVIGKTFYDWSKNGKTVVGIVENTVDYVYNDGYGIAPGTLFPAAAEISAPFQANKVSDDLPGRAFDRLR